MAFVAQPKLHSVLPPLADAAGHRPTIKRHNLLPSPGVHRHLRPGSGSELLDLRDYLPGDPPKTIAWKVSARRDRLITKVFESEVPLRCTIFLDTSHSVRIGPPGSNALARLVEIAAAVSQATSAARDLTGLCVLDDRGVATLLRPARGAKHLVRLLHVLANAAALAPATGQAQANLLVPLAYGLAQEVYPTLLTPDVNAVPGWLGWLWPVPGNQPPPRPLRRIAGWLGLLIAGLPAIVSLWLIYTFRDLLLPFAQIFLPLPGGLLETVALSAMAVGIGLYFGVLHLIPRILPLSVAARRRRLTRWRKALAAILAERYGMVPGGLARLLEDDEEFLALLQRFLAEHQIPYPLPYYDAEGRYLFASPGKIPVLARAILQSVGKGHDNELFVLLVDLLELSEDLDPFLCAVKVARARHHQLMVVCPWPPGMPPPGTHPPVAGGTKPLAAAHLQEQLQNLTTRRLQEAFDRLRRTLARLGVPVICAQSGDPVQLILNRLDRLRSIGQGRWR